MNDPNWMLDRMREYAHAVQVNRDNESIEAISLSDYFLELDEKLCEKPDFPRDWLPF